MSAQFATQAIWEIANVAARARRREIETVFVSQHGRVVQSGLFAGMVLPERVCWGDGDMLPKLLGCYELELHQTLSTILAAHPGLVVNVGAAEGYYAVGLARLLPEVPVFAFDAAELSVDICRDAALLNGVAEQVSVAGPCDPGQLQHLLAGAPRPLLVCDCEGCERELIDPAVAPALSATTMVIECHDFLDAAITQTLINRLDASHELVAIREIGRDPNALAFLQPLSSLDRWLAVCEFRPRIMHWLIATPRSVAA